MITETINPTPCPLPDLATIPADPDAELIDALREASWRIEHMGGRPDPLPGLPEARDLLNKLRELGWTVARESEANSMSATKYDRGSVQLQLNIDEAVMGDE